MWHLQCLHNGALRVRAGPAGQVDDAEKFTTALQQNEFRRIPHGEATTVVAQGLEVSVHDNALRHRSLHVTHESKVNRARVGRILSVCVCHSQRAAKDYR